MPRTTKHGTMFITADGSLNVYGGNDSYPDFVSLPSPNVPWKIGGPQYLSEGAVLICSVQVRYS